MLIQKRILRIACILCKTVHVKFVHILNRRLGAGGIVKRYFVRIRFTQITDFKRQPAIYDGQFPFSGEPSSARRVTKEFCTRYIFPE